MNQNFIRLLASCISLLFASIAFGCDQPFVLAFENTTTSSTLVRWLDLNPNPVHWDIEYGTKGFQPTGIPTKSTIEQLDYEIIDLDSGTAYDIYLRTICEDGQSEWNGPFVFVTNITNPSRCMLNLDIRDNNCPNTNAFNIEVSSEGNTLGQDIFLDRVDLIISHDWPPDLKLALRSPSGTEVLLSEFNGIGSDHYGNPDENTCSQTASFSDLACNSIAKVTPPFIGEFKPEQPMSDFNDGTNPNGIWELLICDRAFGDLGKLESVELIFSERICRIPDTIYLSRIEDLFIDVTWSPIDQCDSINIFIENLSGDLITTKTFSCDLAKGRISNLDPATVYQITFESKCFDDVENMSCPQFFSTSCSPISIQESFDEFEICDPECESECILGTWWNNAKDDDFDWTINNGPTTTSSTGPAEDIRGFGKYIYLESSNPNCGEGSLAILESACIEVISNNNGCDMSFGYHMYGRDVHRLDFEISMNDGEIWQTLFSREGEVSDEWQSIDLDLSPFNGSIAKFRFVAHSTEGTKGDIAIDQIQFYGSQLVDESLINYYRDFDGDGVGIEGERILRCQPIPPPGYSAIFGDCDDQNENIFPGSEEIPCNSIDENCNGDVDDQNPISLSVININEESCLGAFDGSIGLLALGGSEPYAFNWSNGMTGDSISGLTQGVYYAEVADAGGCSIISDFIEINATQRILMSVQNIDNTSCMGAEDGSISIQVSGGSQPYTYAWSNGQTEKDLISLGPGIYTLTITDTNQCKVVSDPILVNNNPKIESGVLLKEDVSCFGNTDGTILIGAIGGVAPYEFKWNTGQNTNMIDSLVPGFYTCTVTDSQGCMSVLKDVEIKSPLDLIANIESFTQVNCFEDQTGSIEINTSGGTPPYTYAWSNGSFSEDIFNLSQGNYSLTISDHNACSFIIPEITIQSPEELEIDVLDIRPTTCLFSNNGSINVSVSGGTPGYQYFWNNIMLDTSFLSGLPTDNYQLTVIDQFGCKKTITDLRVESLDLPLDVAVNIISENLCFGDSTAVLSAILPGGTPPFDYNWSAGEKHIRFELKDTIGSLVSGAYLVTVTDADGCVGVSDELILPEPSPIGLNILQIQDIICYGFSTGSITVDVFGGSGELDLEWSTNESSETISNLESGMYSLTVTDSNSCQLVSQDINISQPEKLSILVETNPATGNQMNGSAQLILSGATPPYQILWDDNTGQQTGPVALNLSTGNYSVTVTDANQCATDTTVFVDIVNSILDNSSPGVVRLFPNPTSGQLSILVDDNRTIQSVSLYTVKGATISATQKIEFFNSSLQKFDFSHFYPGLYFIELILDNGERVLRKLVLTP